ncbi:MAG TPA: hypothetical protein VFA21_02230 [Pyrinomonadaceae bacterium]|nr:hypothetical protein [Pyrinomonadaceae bacterium]
MPEQHTQAEFSEHLNTKFRVLAEAPRPVELELVEVKGWTTRPEEEQGMERFSLVFRGPSDIFVPQQTYRLAHDRMGEMDIFLVPVARESDGFRYEAVFNFRKEK